MDEEDISAPDSPTWESGSMTPGQSAIERQKASLQNYLDSLPYKCESNEEMQAQLEDIVSKICICAETKNWLLLTTWDGMLQCWLLMHYPMSKPTRAKLVRLYYELCLVPGIEPRIIRSWADMLSRLLSNKAEQRRKLEVSDLQLPWRPLWRVLHKELWPKKRLQDNSRNMINILLFVAEQCRRYFPAAEIPDMMEEFLPLLTKDTVLTIVPVVASFVPPTHPHLYLPVLFRIWETFNSSLIDDRLIELCGELSEEHITGKQGNAGNEGGTEWKDAGIWSEHEWNFIAGKALNSMHVPVGATRGASTTASHADVYGDRQSLRIKKPINRANGLAKAFVYSMSLDGPIRTVNGENQQDSLASSQPTGFLAGSRALDTLDKLITSTESYFHPSNQGVWSLQLTLFLHRVTAEFSKRWKEEQEPSCKTPVLRRLTQEMRRAFVTILRTPALLAMFSKDPFSMSYAQASLRSLAFIEPSLIMPDLLERAYSGLEVINETHRTTAVLSMLSGVTHPLVTEKVWLGGQKHVLPLLELCIPGIDLNDPIKTLCTAMFVASLAQYIIIDDVSMQQSGVPLTGDAPAEDLMNLDRGNGDSLPTGLEGSDAPVLSREDERTLAKESTAGFADWVTSLFRRVFALYENLPEEGGKRNTTGGKMEENVVKAVKAMLDVVCLHLSDSLFDLILKIVYDYATTNAKSNAVRAFGQLVACLSRANPEKTIAKFLPYCMEQIREELKHGASSVRTTSAHASIPSDTTLHWNMSILRGCFGNSGATLLKYRPQLLELLSLLVDKTKSERGYSGTGRLINRIVHTLSSVFPVNARFVNTNEWESESFRQNSLAQWGRLYEAQDVKVEWHVPSVDEISFVLEILDHIAAPTLEKIERLVGDAARWDDVMRNDFCRYLHAVRSVWSGLSMLWQETEKDVVNPCLYEEYELPELLVKPLHVRCGFSLTDPEDPRYKKVAAYHVKYGEAIHRAAVALRQLHQGEDHIDAVISVSKAIDVYLLEYAMTRGNFDSLRKAYSQSRDATRMYPKQKTNTRMVLLRRAHAYHAGRVYMHALYRRRDQLDDELLRDLIEMSLSPYTRLRRNAQAILQNACGYYVRSTRFSLPYLFKALARGSDPDRMKGALYMLWNKGTATYALSDVNYHGPYLIALLESQHQEKPSIQKLIGSLAQDALVYLTEEAVHTDAYEDEIPGVVNALTQLKQECNLSSKDQNLLLRAATKFASRSARKNERYVETIAAVLVIATRPTIHWRYVQMAASFLFGLLRRDMSPSADMAKFFMRQCISPHPSIRSIAQKAITRLTCHIKIRTYSKTNEELWLDEWTNPLQTARPYSEGIAVTTNWSSPVTKSDQEYYVDKIRTGFVVQTPTIKGYRYPPLDKSAFSWESASQPAIAAMTAVVESDPFYPTLALLWSQESNKSNAVPELRPDNISFMKSIAKQFERRGLDRLLSVMEPLLIDPDRFKQRAGAEMLAGLLRGSKHWPRQWSIALWTWVSSRLQDIYTNIRPDTVSYWEGAFSEQLVDRDPRRAKPLADWIFSLPLEFHSDSAFAMSKSLSLLYVIIDGIGPRFRPLCDRYMNLFLDNAHTGYAEIRAQIAQNLYAIVVLQWQPIYPSTKAFLEACYSDPDPFRIQNARYMERLQEIARQLPKWKEERLPPPRVTQSQYDKVGLTVLQWIWDFSHGPVAPLVLPYAIALLPEILRMSELNDSSELQKYSSAVLYVLSAVTSSEAYVEAIAERFIEAIKSSESWRVRLNALPTLLVFYYRNLMTVSPRIVSTLMEILLGCLADENVEVRETASKMLSGVVRSSQRQSIVHLKNRFVTLARKTKLPDRRAPGYADALRSLHSAILGLCALIESFPYSVEPWMPPLTDLLADHATDPAPISTTIRKCASEFKKTHQDTWHKDQLAFNEDQLQNLSTMLVGTSYYA